MIVPLDEAKNIRAQNSGVQIVLAVGVFDIIHRGHIDYLKWAKSNGDILVVGVPDDNNVNQHKGDGRPINTQEDRLYLLDSLKPVDYCISIDTYYGAVDKLASLLLPDIIALYNDWSPKDMEKLRQAHTKANILVDKQHKVNSTTSIIERVRKR